MASRSLALFIQMAMANFTYLIKREIISLEHVLAHSCVLPIGLSRISLADYDPREEVL